MWTIYEEIEQAWTKAYKDIERTPDERGLFTEFISDREKEARAKAIVDLQPWLAIFELGIEWLSYVHVALTEGLEKRSEEDRHRYLATWALVGAAVSFGLSIRLLCISGFDTPAKALLRTYIEALLLCLAALNDKQLAEGFVNSQTDEQVKDFWHSMASPKKLHQRIIVMERKLGLAAEDIEQMAQWRREEYEILSQSSHLSYAAAVFTSRAQPLGESEESWHIGVWGMASEASHRTISYAGRMTWYFARLCYASLLGREASDNTLLMLDRDDEWQRKIVLGRDVLSQLVSAHWEEGRRRQFDDGTRSPRERPAS